MPATMNPPDVPTLPTDAVQPHDLARAAYNGDLDRVMALLAAGADPNAPCTTVNALDEGWTPLMHACNAPDVHVQRHAPVVQALLDAGADPCATTPLLEDGSALTAVRFAVERGQDGLVRLLAAHGAPMDPFLPGGPLEFCVRHPWVKAVIQAVRIDQERAELRSSLEMDAFPPVNGGQRVGRPRL